MGYLKLDQLPDPGSRFKLLDEIGSGVCGKVFKATDTESKRTVAIKIQLYDKELREKIEEEYSVYRDNSDHPNLPGFYGVYRKKSGVIDEIWFILEYCEGGSVMNLIQKMNAVGRRMTEQQIAFILKEVAKVIVHLHKNNVMHRDIRGSNVLLSSEGEIKVCDFGLSVKVDTTMGKVSTCIGSPNWMAPEMFTAPTKADDQIYGSRADVWALGILAIEIGDGHPPFHEMHPSRMMFQIVRNPPPTLYRPLNWSQNYNDFVAECLEKNPDNRPFMMEIVEHPFFTELPENDYHICQELKVLMENLEVPEAKYIVDEVAIFDGGLKKYGNPPTKMYVEDLCALDQISESSIMDTLTTRLNDGQSFTYAGDVLLSLNSNNLEEGFPKSLHGKYVAKTRSENLPHIFAVADRAHQDMLHHDDPQYIVLSGETYSGKSTMYRHLLDHLCYIGEGNKNADKKVKESVQVLQAFVNAGTPINNNSTRACILTNLNFGKTGKLSGAIHSVYLLEKARVFSTDMEQSNFHIFYYFYDAMKEKGKLDQFILKDHRSYRYLRIPSKANSSYVRNSVEANVGKFQAIEDSLTDLGFTLDQLNSIYKILSAIILLGELRYKESEEFEGKAELENHETAVNVAKLLGIDEKKFIWALVKYCYINNGSPEQKRHTVDEARDARDVLAAVIYIRLVDWITNIINQKLAFGRAIFGDHYSITIVDMFGFECYRRNRMDQFIINSLNEQMQYYYNQRMFVWEMIEQEEEQIPTITDFHFYDNKLAVDQIMSKPYGLLHLLDDSTRGRHGSDHLIQQVNNKKMQYVKRVSDHEFSVAHYTGKITYDAREFLDRNREFLPPEVVETLRLAGDETIKVMFSNPLNKTGNLTLAFEEPPKDMEIKGRWAGALIAEKQRARKLNTLSHGLYSQIHKMRTQCSVFRATCLDLMKTLSVSAMSSGVHFVRCIRINLDNKPNSVLPEMVQQQIRAMAVVDTANSGKKGYPYRIPFQEFLRRYKFLAFEFNENVELTRDNCRLLLIRLKMEGWVIGKTKVFLKYYNVEYLARLYESQVKKIVKVQAMMRAFLAKKVTAMKLRKQFKKAKQTSLESVREAEKAALFIQKAYRGYMARKQYGPLINLKTGKIDTETATFIRPFAARWKSRSIYQVLLQYRAARHHDLVHFLQQIHLFNQGFLNSLRKTSSCALLERIDPQQNSKSLLGPMPISVWKLPFRLDEIPYFDSSYLCDQGGEKTMMGYESDEECWDAPLQRRQTTSTRIAASSNMAKNFEPFDGNIYYEEPFSRDPSRIRPKSPANPVQNQVKPVKKVSERIGELNSKDNFVVYKKRSNPPPPPPAYKHEPEKPANIYKKRHAPPPPKQTTDFDESRLENRDNNNVFNPIKELQMIAGQMDDAEGDDPPFNFQVLLRKTEYNRASMKRNHSSKSPPKVEMTTTSVTPSKNVIYSSKMEAKERPKSCLGMNQDENKNIIGMSERKLSLQQENLLAKSPDINENNLISDCNDDDINNNSNTGNITEQYIKEEIAPGIILEGYVDEV